MGRLRAAWLSVALALIAATPVSSSPLWGPFADGVHIAGPRPRSEVDAALRAVQPALELCASGPADVLLDATVYAAGVVDRVALYASPSMAAAAEHVDVACVARALQAAPLADRGREPPTRVLARLWFGGAGSAPPAASLTPRVVGEALSAVAGQLSRCVDRAQKKSRDTAGRVLVRFRVEHSPIASNARSVHVEAEPRASALAPCVEALVGDAQFPPLDEDAEVVWPFTFEPTAEPDPRALPPWQRDSLVDCIGCGSLFW